MAAVVEAWGATKGGEAVALVKLSRGGLEVDVTSFGATVVSVRYLGREMTLQHATLAEIEAMDTYYGSTCGRVANRVVGARVEVLGRTYALSANAPPHSLHGGAEGWASKVWTVDEVGGERETPRVRFALDSADGESGYPGAVRATTTFEVRDDALHVAWTCALVSGEATFVNMVQHAYWNLSGDLVDDIRGHALWMPACDRYVEVDGDLLPTGRILSVEGTPLDFRQRRLVQENGDPIVTRVLGQVILGPAIDASDWGAGRRGLDHCLCVDRSTADAETGLALVAILSCDESGVAMTVRSTQPGVQVYSANFLPEDGAPPHTRHRTLCLETQHYPDSPNRAHFPKGVLLTEGGLYSHRAAYAFSSSTRRGPGGRAPPGVVGSGSD